ncbi:MAG: clostripain-related cysteine peptidase [Defluviitaleaceae bacterium]|nr:clostripain-related cysteine peptidase [Defluviitaleaceae bacterium]
MKHIRKYASILVAVLFIAICTSAARPNIKPYTIMIYMNGSDLESDFGAATTDLIEILESGLDTKNANVIILTGGTKRWQNAVIPETECIIWEAADGVLSEVTSLGMVNMGKPSTLKDFISYGMNNYPAEKYGLILWDHGGGSIAGFGHDEKFSDASLTLADMQLAFEEAGLRKNKLEFLGFDACLMATIEMAVIAADYAHVLIASEDLEPGDGWDYVFLSALNHNPRMNGFALGEVIVDTFMDFYGPNSDEILNLSVIDLARIQPVMAAMGRLMSIASSSMKSPEGPSFNDLATRRGITRTFGEGSPRDNYSDMVDIGNMALTLLDLFPNQAMALLRTLDSCVVYHRHNSDTEVYGLSTFYIYGGKSEGIESLNTYSNLNMDSSYTQYLHHFFNGLVNKSTMHMDPIRSELALWQPISQNRYRMAGLLQTATAGEGLLWPSLNGQPITMYPIMQTSRTRFYAVPAQINGREGDIIIIFNNSLPQGQVKGIRYRDGHVIQKGHDPIERGDKIAIYALEWDFDKSVNEVNWHKGETFTVTGSLHLTWDTAPMGYRVGYRFTNLFNEVEYTTPFVCN